MKDRLEQALENLRVATDARLNTRVDAALACQALAASMKQYEVLQGKESDALDEYLKRMRELKALLQEASSNPPE